MDISHSKYKGAFEAYLRKGTPIVWASKQNHPTTHYIWRTAGDIKVRDSHVANNGKIFAWSDPPPTGHPGEDYGCRCVAEPYYPSIGEHLDITISNVSDMGARWRSRDFVYHYYNGKGRGVKVRQIGHLRSIVDEYLKIVIDDITRLPSQIAQKARQSENGSFSDGFYYTYNMTNVVFSIGDTTIGGEFTGYSSKKNGILTLSGKIDFYLKDEFADPVDIGIEFIDLNETIDENIRRPVERRIQRRINRIISDQTKANKQDRLGIHTGEPYSITDEWAANFEGQIYEDSSRSSFG